MRWDPGSTRGSRLYWSRHCSWDPCCQDDVGSGHSQWRRGSGWKCCGSATIHWCRRPSCSCQSCDDRCWGSSRCLSLKATTAPLCSRRRNDSSAGRFSIAPSG